MSEQDRARLSRMSFGDVRLSENFGDLSRLDGASETGDVTTLQQGNDEEAQDDTTLGQGAFDAGYVKTLLLPRLIALIKFKRRNRGSRTV